MADLRVLQLVDALNLVRQLDRRQGVWRVERGGQSTLIQNFNGRSTIPSFPPSPATRRASTPGAEGLRVPEHDIYNRPTRQGDALSAAIAGVARRQTCRWHVRRAGATTHLQTAKMPAASVLACCTATDLIERWFAGESIGAVPDGDDPCVAPEGPSGSSEMKWSTAGTAREGIVAARRPPVSRQAERDILATLEAQNLGSALPGDG
jgi:hypothetical protein